MSTTVSDKPSGTAIVASLRLSKALALAQRGECAAAQRLLSPQGSLPSHNTELQALAALVTTAGDYERALELWRQLLQRQPQNAEARRMIGSIEVWLARPSWAPYVPWACGGAVVLVALVLFLTLGSGSPAPKAPVRPAVTPVQTVPATTPARRTTPPPPPAEDDSFTIGVPSTGSSRRR